MIRWMTLDAAKLYESSCSCWDCYLILELYDGTRWYKKFYESRDVAQSVCESAWVGIDMNMKLFIDTSFLTTFPFEMKWWHVKLQKYVKLVVSRWLYQFEMKWWHVKLQNYVNLVASRWLFQSEMKWWLLISQIICDRKYMMAFDEWCWDFYLRLK